MLHQGMGRYILEAIGEHAKQRVGGANLLLWTDKPVLLGRAIKETEGYKFPNHWNSLSSKHCKLTYLDGHFEVEDTSTNGTFINGQRIGRGNKAQLHPKDTLGLSLVPPTAVLPNQDFVNTVEYRLEFFEQTPPAADQLLQASPALLAKRRHSGSPSTVAKRPRTEVDAGDLLQLKAKNDELRQLNDDYRAKLDELDQQLQAAEASKQETAAQHAQQLQDLEGQVRAEAGEQLKSLQDELAAEKQHHEELKALLKQQQVDAADAQTQHKQQLEQLQAELQESKQQLNNTTEQLQSHQQQLTDARSNINALQSDLKQQQDLTAAAELSATGKQQQIDELAIQAQSLQHQVQQLTEELAAVQVGFGKEQAARSAAEMREREAVMRVSQAERVAAAAKEQFDSKKEEVMLFNAQAGQIRQQLEQHGAQVLSQFNAIQSTTQAFTALLAQLTPQQAGLSTALTAFMDSMGNGLQQMQAISKPAGVVGLMNGQALMGNLNEQQQQEEEEEQEGGELDQRERHQQQQDAMEGVVAGTQAGQNSQQAPAAAEDNAPMTQPAGSGNGSPASSRQTDPLSVNAAGGGVSGGGVSGGSAAEMPPPPHVVMGTPGNSHHSQQQQQQLFSPGLVAQDFTQDFAAMQGSASVTKTQVVVPGGAAGGSTAVGDDAGMTLQLLLPSGAANSDHVEAAGHAQQQTGNMQNSAGVEHTADMHADDRVDGQIDREGAAAAAAADPGSAVGADDDGNDHDGDLEDEEMQDVDDLALLEDEAAAAAEGNTAAVAEPAVESLRVGGQGPTGDTLGLLLEAEGVAAADGAQHDGDVVDHHDADGDDHDRLEGAQAKEDGIYHQQQQQQTDHEVELDHDAASEDVTENPEDEELGLTPEDSQQQQQQQQDNDQRAQEHPHASGGKQSMHQQDGFWGNGVGGSPAQRPKSQPALGDIMNQQQGGMGRYMKGVGGSM